MQSLTIIGRRWFQKGPGNTYHSAQIRIDGQPVEGIAYAYGYGDHYLTTAFEKLEADGLLNPPRILNGRELEPPWQWAQRTGVQFTNVVIDVARKKDL